MTIQKLFDTADYYKELIQIQRSNNQEQLIELDNHIRVNCIYKSISFDGNPLTLTDTKLLLEEGVTVGGKVNRDYYEIAGLAQAYDYMLTIARSEKQNVTEEVIKQLHYLSYHQLDHEEAGQYRRKSVSLTDTKHRPPKAEEISHFMEHFISQMQYSLRLMHPIEFAAISHKRLLDIHPFQEGNGRIAGLLMNLVLVRAGYEVTSISPALRKQYIHALELAQNIENLNIDDFIRFIAQCVIETEKEYCSLLRI